MSNFGVMHALFLVVIPLGALLAFTADDIVSFLNNAFGFGVNKGDIVIVYILISVLVSRIGLKRDRQKPKEL